MASWHVDEGLAVFIGQMKAAYPGITIGTIGDASHQGGTSDHNPENDGSVDAADPMIGGRFTHGECQRVVNALVRSRDERIAYIIWNRHITSSTVQPWKWRVYTGNDPHTGHLHLSVNDKHHSNRRPWRIGMQEDNRRRVDLDPFTLPILTQGMNDNDYPGYDHIKRAQDILGVTIDGDYGPATAKAVKERGYGNGKTINLPVWIDLYGLSTLPMA